MIDKPGKQIASVSEDKEELLQRGAKAPPWVKAFDPPASFVNFATGFSCESIGHLADQV
jgi:hypothetical protein